MTQELLNILLSVVSLVITGLVGWGVTMLTTWLTSKIKDTKLSSWMTQITEIVSSAVMSVFQTTVEVLKKNGTFDEKAQEQAKDKALNIIKNQLTPNLKKFIETNFGDIDEWISNKIEASIYNLKNLNKKNK